MFGKMLKLGKNSFSPVDGTKWNCYNYTNVCWKIVQRYAQPKEGERMCACE
jgi:hypothetical protein